MIDTLTKEQTERLIFIFESIEDEIGKQPKDFPIYLCCRAEELYCNNIITVEDYRLASVYIKFWMHDDGIYRFVAYGHRQPEFVVDDPRFARLVWIDFMLLELYDHLNLLEN